MGAPKPGRGKIFRGGGGGGKGGGGGEGGGGGGGGLERKGGRKGGRKKEIFLLRCLTEWPMGWIVLGLVWFGLVLAMRRDSLAFGGNGS